MKIEIQGFETGLLVASGDGFREECLCEKKHGVFLVEFDGKSFCVTGAYSPKGAANGCWVIGVQPVDEGIPIPEITVLYSSNATLDGPVLTIDLPEGATIKAVNSD